VRNLKIKTYAKVNITLDITGKRPNGYHDVRMIMQTISLCDDIDIEKNKDIIVSCDVSYIPCNQTNLAYKAAKAFFEYKGIDCGAKIHITKRIPSGAGLGGGSSNAAGVIMALNTIYEAGLSTKECMLIGAKIGADVPFFILGGTCLAEGIGEKLTPLPHMPKCYIVLAKPAFSVSTKSVYQNLDLSKIYIKPHTTQVISAIKGGNMLSIASGMVNVLETVSSKKYPEIETYKKEMLSCGALGSIMSGSGSTVFSVFDNLEKAQNCVEVMRKHTKDVFLCTTV